MPANAPAAGGGSQIFAPELLRGHVALVTGGGTGLGRATAVELARCGARVVVCGRREDVLADAVEEIGDIGEASLVAGDVRDAEQARAIVDLALERHGRLDILVNNAGGQYFSPAELIALKGWQAVWRLNVDGMLNMAQAAFERAFARTEGGTVVNVTLSPHHGMPGMAHSGAARATVEALTRELAERWRGDGVTVAAVAPGPFDTEVLSKYPSGVREGAAATVPLQRLGQPREHAWLVALLCSPLGAAFSGQTVTLDGARDNWVGAWPPVGLADESGAVPTEARRGG
jgi:citronellol/citronellal dehydrogenase